MIEDSDFVPDIIKKHIDSIILGSDNMPSKMALYRSQSCVCGDGNPQYTHVFVTRDENGNPNTHHNDRITSGLAGVFIDLLDLFTSKHGIEYTNILRGAVNMTCPEVNTSGSIGLWHRDHDFDYRHLIVYLNDSFVGKGSTFIDVDGEVIEVSSERYKAVYIDRPYKHAMQFSELGERYVAVFTFI